VSRPVLDWSDPIAVSKWLAGLRLSWNDADAAVLDMLRPLRARELGPALHREKYTDARAQIIQALDFATTPEPDDGAPGAPASNGGPVH
jgi:hypothetical protein